jgi:hypothetical protein
MYTSQHSLQISRERARPAAGRLALSRSLGSRATLGHGFYGATMNQWMFEMFSHFLGTEWRTGDERLEIRPSENVDLNVGFQVMFHHGFHPKKHDKTL